MFPMREKICFDKNWRFHKGDIEHVTPNFKGVMYAQAKTKRKEYGPAAITYDSAPDSYDKEKGINPERWDNVDLPHDFVISGTPDEKNNNALGYLEYDNAWYIKRFKLSENDKGKRLKLYFEGVAIHATVYVNGVSKGRQQMEKYSRGDWRVVYEPGEITAIGYIGGKAAASETLKTTGKPVALKLELQNGEDISANGDDLAVIHCTCVDENGLTVPDANPFVSFTTNGLGSVAGTGSDNTDHIVPSCPDRKMYAGVIAAAIKLGDTAGTLSVYAGADGLKTARTDIEIK